MAVPTATMPTSSRNFPPCSDSLDRLVEHRGRAMGSSLHIIATGDPASIKPVLAWAVGRVDQLEQRWSRFIKTSEVSLLNATPGRAQAVSADTMLLVRRALEARRLSGGRFDPTLLQAMRANGYDRTFVAIKTPAGLAPLDLPHAGPGQIEVDFEAQTVRLSATTGFDPGGIGKGLAADMVAQEMLNRGADGALVNIGGDVRCIGEGPADGTWIIAAGDDVAGVDNQILALSEGGVATSTKTRRRWKTEGGDGQVEAHHLLAAATGRSAATAANLAIVIAGTCADAEWIATAIAADGSLPLDRSMIGNATVMLTRHNGAREFAGSPERFLQ